VAIHPELVELDAQLKSFGEVARAIMDDIYAVGPADVVFAAVARFRDRVAASLDLRIAPSKLGCYSIEAELDNHLGRIALGAPIGTIATQSPLPPADALGPKASNRLAD
jgi:hypothetical protein